MKGEGKVGNLIKKAQLVDFERLQPIHKEVHDLHVKGRPDIYKITNQTLDHSYFEQLVESDEGVIYIIEKGNEIIAFTILRINETPDRTTAVKKKYLFMEDLGVKEEYRGKGLGKLLYQKAIEFARENETTSLELGVWEFNEEAIKFYKSMGMKNQARKMEIQID